MHGGPGLGGRGPDRFGEDSGVAVAGVVGDRDDRSDHGGYPLKGMRQGMNKGVERQAGATAGAGAAAVTVAALHSGKH
ncbi:hypothetical protein GCM10010326_67950 [Streptomyces xanthochromogenes]|uniref:Uncharacterized protein n=1 Tax=Streptomyces xanthochromogenes TaxID=67384 RepID=A0ABQ3ARX5_9ACTN|nr:hypothetical protein GCM10010326_67950 [Streptomyces xanthochromogenes]